jgi:hypothetical protein
LRAHEKSLLILIRKKDNEDYAIWYRIEKDKMKKIKLIKKLASLALIGGGVLTSIPLITTSCSTTPVDYQKKMIQYLSKYAKTLPDPGTTN